MQAGERNSVMLEVTDDLSGVAKVYVYMKSNSGKQTVNSSATYQEDGTWKADFQLSEFAEDGEWYVDFIILGDKAGNDQSYYSKRDFNVKFKVENVNSDTTPPELHTIKIEKEKNASW